jgi:hypothetical protein
MKFVKTIHKWEAGLQRVTPFGTLVFNYNGVCAIGDDELAIKVANCSPSLVLAEEGDEAVKLLLLELEAQDRMNNKPVDENKISSFISSERNGQGVTVDVIDTSNVIGSPADDNGISKSIESPKVEAVNVIGTPAPLNATNDKDAPESSNDTMKELESMSYSDIKELIEASGVDLEKFSHNEKKSKDGLLKIASDNKILG